MPANSVNTVSSHFSIRPSSSAVSAQFHLIFFITGNPGLIAYYNTFLSTLHTLISESRKDSSVFHIYGQSLAGFSNDLAGRQTPYNLEEQINFLLSTLQSQQFQNKPYQSVTLIGHSVGSYILLELISRLRKSPTPTLNICGGVLLFPTVTHIAASNSGVKLTALLRIPNFPRHASRIADALLWPLSRIAVKMLVRAVTGMPEEAALVTTEFLKNDRAIWQALYLAKDEMETITEDKWDSDIWGIEHEDLEQKTSIPKLIFYFGQNDHWVANHTRDALIAARARQTWDDKSSKPIMLIDQNGIDHGFCIQHSESIAEKCKDWIENIIASR